MNQIEVWGWNGARMPFLIVAVPGGNYPVGLHYRRATKLAEVTLTAEQTETLGVFFAGHDDGRLQIGYASGAVTVTFAATRGAVTVFARPAPAWRPYWAAGEVRETDLALSGHELQTLRGLFPVPVPS